MTLYFLGSRLLAQSQLLPKWSDTEPASASLALFCPTCGEVWGRVIVDGSQWHPVNRGCRAHPPCNDVGGTFIAPWRSTFAELPPEVLRYEAMIRLMEKSCP